MYSNKKFERLFIYYNSEAVSDGICLRNGIRILLERLGYDNLLPMNIRINLIIFKT